MPGTDCDTIMKKYFLNLILLIIPFSTFSQTVEVPFTLADRDRIIQIEEKLNSQQVQINDIKEEIGSLRDEMRGDIKSVRDEIQSVRNELTTVFYSGFAIITAFLVLILGFFFLIWRRLPEPGAIKKKPYSASKREKLLETILKDFAKGQPKIAEILETHGL